MPSIFLSYRRTDAAGHAGRLYDRLVDRFGETSIFKDLDSMEPGADFGEVIEHTVARCDALIAVIGREWLAADEGGLRRLDSPDDWVRLEIGNALKRNVRVIPVLVEGARMPSAADLPDDLQALARRHAVELSESAWNPQVRQLLDALETLVSDVASLNQLQSTSAGVASPGAPRDRPDTTPPPSTSSASGHTGRRAATPLLRTTALGHVERPPRSQGEANTTKHGRARWTAKVIDNKFGGWQVLVQLTAETHVVRWRGQVIRWRFEIDGKDALGVRMPGREHLGRGRFPLSDGDTVRTLTFGGKWATAGEDKSDLVLKVDNMPLLTFRPR